MNIKNRYDKPTRVTLKCGPGKTRQSFKAECDIKTIVKRFNKTGQLPNMIKKEPRYGDFSESMDYMESMNTVITAQEQFAGLPSAVRRRFQNAPEQFLEFASNPKNGAEMIKMGLAEAIPQAEPEKTVIAPKKEKKVENTEPPKKVGPDKD